VKCLPVVNARMAYYSIKTFLPSINKIVDIVFIGYCCYKSETTCLNHTAPPSYDDVLATAPNEPVLSSRESTFIDPIIHHDNNHHDNSHHDNNRQSGYLVTPQVTSPVSPGGS